MSLPAGGSPYRIAMVCLGNICRSPMADVVLTAMLSDAGLSEAVEVTSSGTGGWHTGEPMDQRAAATLAAAGHDPTRHRASHFDAGWLDRDLILAMDAQNLADIRALGARADQVRLLRSFDAAAPEGAEVPDPWYGGQGGFDDVLAMVTRSCAGLVDELHARLD